MSRAFGDAYKRGLPAGAVEVWAGPSEQHHSGEHALPRPVGAPAVAHRSSGTAQFDQLEAGEQTVLDPGHEVKGGVKSAVVGVVRMALACPAPEGTCLEGRQDGAGPPP